MPNNKLNKEQLENLVYNMKQRIEWCKNIQRDYELQKEAVDKMLEDLKTDEKNSAEKAN
jgi:hypothetical protein